MKILKADYRSASGPKDFVQSLRDTGFAVVTNHPISSLLIDQVYADWKHYFASDEKKADLFDKETQAGYFPFRSENAKDNPKKDLKEFFHIYQGKKFPKNMGSATWDLYGALMALGRDLLQWIQDSSPEELRAHYSMPLPQMLDGSQKNLFRIIHYPPLTGVEEEGAVRAAAHEDINLITLLPASTAMGLQVKDLEGQWHEVPGNYGDIVVNVGDMLQEASGGYFVSTTHRVMNPSGELAKKPRYSMPLFIHPQDDVRLSERYTAIAYLEQRLREIGLKA
jgi:isopenicillin N synthase-like dioxygenase